ncbi:hypothetical protein Bhyg_12258 [Pseudolycoriella hygida]|uniref:Uncharacterized protein n=1 Tax=Pseudolycoriella hygida TaxID=35572 RepID=A0A9Q0S095_9DIPT|nr:hypothetical protein Bhyg_12258 [Pseudolycoriella hygida]
MYAKQLQNKEKAANSNDNSIINDSYVPRRDAPRMETEYVVRFKRDRNNSIIGKDDSGGCLIALKKNFSSKRRFTGS